MHLATANFGLVLNSNLGFNMKIKKLDQVIVFLTFFLLFESLPCFPCTPVQQCEDNWCCFACKQSLTNVEQCFWAEEYLQGQWSTIRANCCGENLPLVCMGGVNIGDAKFYLGHGESFVPQGYQDFYCYIDQYGACYGGVMYTHMVVICNAVEDSGSIQVMDPWDGMIVWNRYSWMAFSEVIPQ